MLNVVFAVIVVFVSPLSMKYQIVPGLFSVIVKLNGMLSFVANQVPGWMITGTGIVASSFNVLFSLILNLFEVSVQPIAQMYVPSGMVLVILAIVFSILPEVVVLRWNAPDELRYKLQRHLKQV